ncbi:MAG: acetate kinase [Clostridiales bacterium]|nr:acetate kinase [Clostridiales bacterium]
MKILIVNAGSSSLKYQLINMDNEATIAQGMIERIGIEGGKLTQKANGEKRVIMSDMKDHLDAVAMMIQVLTDKDYGVITSMDEVGAVGHRVVQGGELFTASAVINDEVIAAIEKNVQLAPLHNPANLMGIYACQKIMPNTPMVAVFDTAFHQTMPPKSYLYGVPMEYYERLRVRRYGFHGTSHRYVSQRAAEILGRPIEELRLVTCHLGNGSSMAAVQFGKSVDTSMGMTPLEGVIMGTRSGNVDPAVLQFIMNHENLDINQMLDILNKQSGFLGISSVSSDMRDVEEAAANGDRNSQIAIDMLYQGIKKYIAAYAAVMGGVDAVIFTAGIGENGWELREGVLENMEFLGIKFDKEKNKVRGKEIEISTPDSKVKVLVVPTNEEIVIARDTLALVGK